MLQSMRSPRGHQELDSTEQLSTNHCTVSGGEKETVQGTSKPAVRSTWTLTLCELGSNGSQGDAEMHHPDSPSRKGQLQGRTLCLLNSSKVHLGCINRKVSC